MPHIVLEYSSNLNDTGDWPAILEKLHPAVIFTPATKGRWRELSFSVTNSDWSAFTLYHMKLEEGGWTQPTAAPFLGSDSSGLTACLSFEMDRAFFTDARPSYPPADIWMSERTDAGWSEPVEMGRSDQLGRRRMGGGDPSERHPLLLLQPRRRAG